MDRIEDSTFSWKDFAVSNSALFTYLGMAVGLMMILVGIIFFKDGNGIVGGILTSFGVGMLLVGLQFFIQLGIQEKTAILELQATTQIFKDKLGSVLDRQHENLTDIKEILSEMQLERFTMLKERVNKQMNRVFSEHVSRWIDKVARAQEKQEIILEGDEVDLFRHFYKRMLQEFSGAKFLATSVPSTRFFWAENDPLYEAFKEFLKKGGSMARIFFLEKPEPSQLSLDEFKILHQQKELGINIGVVGWQDMPREIRESFFVVETEGRIAWEVYAQQAEITKVIATTEPQRCALLLKKFEKITAEASKIVTLDVEKQSWVLEPWNGNSTGN